MIRTHELEHSSMATVLEVRGLTRMIELPPKVRKPQPLINTPSLTAAAAPEEAPALQLDADPEAAAKLEEEKKKAAAEAVARESMPRMRMIFSNVSFSLNRGTTLALVGPPKCGKTQLLRAIAQLDPTHGGEVLLNGKEAEEVGFTAWRTRIAYVQQKQIRLTAATGGNIPREYFNSIMNLSAHKERRTRFADPMLIARKWNLDDKCFESPWETLSPSEHQRMMLAIALACKPEVLLLDEPCSCLDLQLALQVEKTIRSLGLSVIWVTRDIYQAERVADHVIEFNTLTHIDPLVAADHEDDDLIFSDELHEFVSEANDARQEAARVVADVSAQLNLSDSRSPEKKSDASPKRSPSPRMHRAATTVMSLPGTMSFISVDRGGPVEVLIDDDSKDQTLNVDPDAEPNLL